MILLDSSLLIELFRIKDKSQSYYYKLALVEQKFAISVITYYENLIGSNEKQNDFWNKLFSTLVILPFDIKCSTEAIQIYKDLKQINKFIDLADITIAATAKAFKLKLATLNIKHFVDIKDLKLIK